MESLFNIDFAKISSSSKKEALDRRKNFDKTLAGRLGFNPNEKPFDIKAVIKNIKEQFK